MWLIIISALITLVSFGYLYLTWNFNYWKDRDVPGPRPKPFLGTFSSTFTQKEHPIDENNRIYREYKNAVPFIGGFSFRSPQLFVLSPALVKDILVKFHQHFKANEMGGTIDPKADPLLARNPFFLDGEEWRLKRAQISPAFTNSRLLHLPIVIFVPALAFNQVSGVNVHFITSIVCTVCIFYTGVGGIKAVVWTDVVQTIVMVGALILIVIKGTADIGGLGVLIERNLASGRIEPPNFNLDPTERTTIWAIFFGGGSFWIAKNSIHQMMIQRYLSLPSLADARKALILFTIGMICLMMTCFYNGLLIYATFHDCDPLTTKLAKEKDQLLPILVMKVFGDYPGMAGLFISGIFSASLSSLSTGLNSLAAVVLEDFVKPFLGFDLTERQTRYLMRGTVLLFGVIAVALVMVVEKLGTVLQLSMSLVPISLGPLLGVFLMGMLLPWINAKSALAGTCTGLLTMSYIVIRAQISIAIKEISHPIKPLSVAGCTYAFTNITKPLDETNHIPTEKSIHHVSFLFYTLIGVFSTCVSGIIYSFIFGRENISEMDPLLVAPFLRSAVFPKRPTPITAVVHSFEKVDTKL